MLICCNDFIDDGEWASVKINPMENFNDDTQVFSDDYSVMNIPKEIAEDIKDEKSIVIIYLLSLIASHKIMKKQDIDFGIENLRSIRMTHYHFGSDRVMNAIEYITNEFGTNIFFSELIGKLTRSFSILKSDLFYNDKNRVTIFEVYGYLPVNSFVI